MPKKDGNSARKRDSGQAPEPRTSTLLSLSDVAKNLDTERGSLSHFLEQSGAATRQEQVVEIPQYTARPDGRVKAIAFFEQYRQRYVEQGIVTREDLAAFDAKLITNIRSQCQRERRDPNSVLPPKGIDRFTQRLEEAKIPVADVIKYAPTLSRSYDRSAELTAPRRGGGRTGVLDDPAFRRVAAANQWSTRKDRGLPHRMGILDFLRDVYGRWLGGAMTQADLHAVDKLAYGAFRSKIAKDNVKIPEQFPLPSSRDKPLKEG